jgi:hypothetical protein|tara:strand:+ start:168 stop:425 length:258 start_codon:yes stop_codon:yes gene_type:complete
MKQNKNDEYHEYMSWLYEQVKSVSPDISVEEFEELISLDGWDLENYIISRKITIEGEKELERTVGADWKTKLYNKWLKYRDTCDV